MSAPPLRVVDPHIHLWDLWTRIYPHFETPTRSAQGSNAAIARSYLLEEFLGEGEGLVETLAAVHVEAFPTDPLRETETLAAVAERSPIPIAVVGHADLTAADLGALLDRHAAFSCFRGIRQVVNIPRRQAPGRAGRDLLADPRFAGGLRLLGARGLSFDLQLYPHQAEQAARLAGAAPDTPIALNHAALWVERDRAGWAEWKAALRVLAARPNIVVKISGLGMNDRGWTTESIRPLVLETLEAFGTGRAMFASNFPVDKLSGTYPALWRAFADITADATPEEHEALFRANAARFYGLVIERE